MLEGMCTWTAAGIRTQKPALPLFGWGKAGPFSNFFLTAVLRNVLNQFNNRFYIVISEFFDN